MEDQEEWLLQFQISEKRLMVTSAIKFSRFNTGHLILTRSWKDLGVAA